MPKTRAGHTKGALESSTLEVIARSAAMAALAVVMTASLLLTGCSKGPAPVPQPAPVPALGQPGGAPTGAVPTRPRLEQQRNGASAAYGWLRRIDLEGGFWAVVAEPPGAGAGAGGGNPTIVAVLLPGKVLESGIARLEGAYVVAVGARLAGASIRMAGPEITVDEIAAVGSGK